VTERSCWETRTRPAASAPNSVLTASVSTIAGVDAEFVMSGDYTLEVAGEHVPAEPFLKPLYDPPGLRLKA